MRIYETLVTSLTECSAIIVTSAVIRSSAVIYFTALLLCVQLLHLCNKIRANTGC